MYISLFSVYTSMPTRNGISLTVMLFACTLRYTFVRMAKFTIFWKWSTVICMMYYYCMWHYLTNHEFFNCQIHNSEFVLMLIPFFPELVMPTDLLHFEHHSELLFCSTLICKNSIFPGRFSHTSVHIQKLRYIGNKRKRKRSDSVLWQKPLHQQKCQKGKVTTQTTPQKSSIKQRLRTDLGRSVGVTTATQLVWFTGFTGPTFPLTATAM